MAADNNLIKIDYKKLKDCILNKMPSEYLQGSVVKQCYYDRPYFDFEFNYDPYKNGGKILPTEIKFCNKDYLVEQNGEPINKFYYKFDSTGYDWLPKYFYLTELCNEQHLLPLFL